MSFDMSDLSDPLVQAAVDMHGESSRGSGSDSVSIKLPPPPQPSRGLKLLGYAAVAAVLIYTAFLFVPQGIPLLDANRQLLAETERQGYCAGEVLINTRGYGSSEQMAGCMEENGRNNDKDLDIVQSAFCDAVYNKAGMPKSDCMDVVSQQSYWPTLKGTVTNAWNRAFPYPGSNALDVGVQGDSRTGDRETNDRIGESRP